MEFQFKQVVAKKVPIHQAHFLKIQMLIIKGPEEVATALGVFL